MPRETFAEVGPRIDRIDRDTCDWLRESITALLPRAKSLPYLLSVTTAPRHMTTARQLIYSGESTFLSRFIRMGLPSTYTLLTAARLVRLRAVFDGNVSNTHAALAFYAASPQGLARTIKACTGKTPVRWQEATTSGRMKCEFIELWIERYAAQWQRFDPYVDRETFRRTMARHRLAVAA